MGFFFSYKFEGVFNHGLPNKAVGSNLLKIKPHLVLYLFKRRLSMVGVCNFESLKLGLGFRFSET